MFRYLVEHEGLGGPKHFMIRPIARRGLPPIVQAWRGNCVGSAAGDGLNAIYTASNEFEERQYFSSPMHASRRRLADLRDQQFARSLRIALAQTANFAGFERLESEEFECVPAVEITTGRLIEIPAVLVSLGYHGKTHDIVPLNDSSGSAGHKTPDACYSAALLEFVERQSLIAAWLGKKPERSIIMGEAPGLFSSDAEAAISAMTSRGRIHLVDISTGWPVHCCLAMFEASDDKHVQFAVGVSAKWGAMAAIEKSIYELWQAYYHLELMLNGSMGKRNRLEENYFRGNRTSSVSGFGIKKKKTYNAYQERDALCRWLNEPNDNLAALVKSLGRVSSNIAYFTGAAGRGAGLGYYGTVKSPDFYLHLDVSRSINLINRFAIVCGIPYRTPPRGPIPFA